MIFDPCFGVIKQKQVFDWYFDMIKHIMGPKFD
jgi:hypothetical protein